MLPADTGPLQPGQLFGPGSAARQPKETTETARKLNAAELLIYSLHPQDPRGNDRGYLLGNMPEGAAAKTGDGSHELRWKTSAPVGVADQDTVHRHAPDIGRADLRKHLVTNHLFFLAAIKPREGTTRRRPITDQDDGLEPRIGTIQHLERLLDGISQAGTQVRDAGTDKGHRRPLVGGRCLDQLPSEARHLPAVEEHPEFRIGVQLGDGPRHLPPLDVKAAAIVHGERLIKTEYDIARLVGLAVEDNELRSLLLLAIFTPRLEGQIKVFLAAGALPGRDGLGPRERGQQQHRQERNYSVLHDLKLRLKEPAFILRYMKSV